MMFISKAISRGSLMGCKQALQRFSTQNLSQETTVATEQPVKLKKKPLRFFLALLGLNVGLAIGYAKKVEYDNRYSFTILMKLLNFKSAYEENPNKHSIEEIKKLFDEFLVENVALTLDEKHTEGIRKIAKQLCEKYPKERELQLFMSEVCEYERRGVYLKAAMVLDRKYIDDVLIRQMALNCERYGKDKPFFYDEFYDACTKYSLEAKYNEAEDCLQHYLSLNPASYYRAAVQQIKNYRDNKQNDKMLSQIQKLFDHETDLDIKEKESVLQILNQAEIIQQDDQIKAGNMLLDVNPEKAEQFAKQLLAKDKKNLHALKLQAQCLQKQAKTEQLTSVVASIKKLEPGFELKSV